MKKIVLFAATLMVGAFMFASCSGGSPKASAEKYLTAFFRMDYEEAKKFATEDTKKQLDMMAQLSGMMGDTMKKQAKKAVVNVTEVKEDGNNATVTYTVKPDGVKQDAGTQTLKMMKENGKWLASWNKQDALVSMGGGAGAGAAEPAPAPMDNNMAPGATPMEPAAPGTAPAAPAPVK